MKTTAAFPDQLTEGRVIHPACGVFSFQIVTDEEFGQAGVLGMYRLLRAIHARMPSVSRA